MKLQRQHGVVAVTIDGEPWFVAADVCKALSIANMSDATSNLGSTDVQNYRVPGTRGRANKIVSESGLYQMIFQSRKPEAKEFTHWVTGTVLPAIRKDGGYILGEEKVATGEMDEDELVLKAMEVMKRKIERLQVENTGMREVQLMVTFPTTYEFNQQSIRVITIDGEPWFVGADLLTVLFGTSSGKADAYRKLASDEKTKVDRIAFGLGYGRAMVVVSESGFYRLFMRSDKPEALEFQDWVTREVLPSIRKTGSYVAGGENAATGEIERLPYRKACDIACNTMLSMAYVLFPWLFVDVLHGNEQGDTPMIYTEATEADMRTALDMFEQRRHELLAGEHTDVFMGFDVKGRPISIEASDGMLEKETAVLGTVTQMLNALVGQGEE